MQIVKNEFQVKSNLENESVKFGIKDVGKIAHLLISQYTSPIQTLVQEYISNAIDATNEAGSDENIKVNIPNMLNNYTFSVRDFGVGLSKERIENIFTQFGGTTKDTSNGQIGGFGIGAKSGLAYSDKFYVTSFIDGTKTKYMVFKTSNGVELKAVFKEPTNERNGVLIELDTDQYDHRKFKKAVYRMANFLPKRPIINEPEESQVFLSEGLKVNDNVTIYQEKDLEPLFTRNTPRVIINYGGVPYCIDSHDVDEHLLHDSVGYGACVVVNCEIGKFMPIQTREQLDYSNKLTQANMTPVLTESWKEVERYKKQFFDGVKSIKEMRQKIQNYYNYFGKQVTKKFKGVQIYHTTINHLKNIDVMNINRYGKWRSKIVKKITYNKNEKYFKHTDRLFYIDTGENESVWKRRVRYNLMEICTEPIVVLRLPFKADKTNRKVFRKVIQELDVRPISELKMPPKKAKGTSNYSYTKRENTKVYLNKDYWLDLSENTDKFVYCDEDTFAPWKRYLFAENGMTLVFSSATHLKKIEKDENFTHIDNYSLDNLITDDMIRDTEAQLIFKRSTLNGYDFPFENAHLAKGKVKRSVTLLKPYFRNYLSYKEITQFTNKRIDHKRVNKLRKEVYKLREWLKLAGDPREGQRYYYGSSKKMRVAKDRLKDMNKLNKIAEVF